MFKDCTLLLLSCDSRADIWRPSLALFDRHWPDCPFRRVFVGETRGPGMPGWSEFLGGKIPWSDLLLAALEKVESPEVVLVLDDFLLARPVNTERVISTIEEGERLGARCVRLRATSQGGEEVSELFKAARPENRHALQIAWWKKDSLWALLHPGRDPWQFEAESEASAIPCEAVLVVKEDAIPYVDALRAGRWTPRGRSVARNNGFQLNPARPVMCWNNAR